MFTNGLAMGMTVSDVDGMAVGQFAAISRAWRRINGAGESKPGDRPLTDEDIERARALGVEGL